MLDLTKLYLYVFGALTLGGGVMGYVKAKSRPSLIAGGVSGILLFLSAYLLGSGSVVGGLLLALVQSTALAVRFVPTFLKGRKFMPAGLMALLSLGGIVMTLLAFIVAR